MKIDISNIFVDGIQLSDWLAKRKSNEVSLFFKQEVNEHKKNRPKIKQKITIKTKYDTGAGNVKIYTRKEINLTHGGEIMKSTLLNSTSLIKRVIAILIYCPEQQTPNGIRQLLSGYNIKATKKSISITLSRLYKSDFGFLIERQNVKVDGIRSSYGYKPIPMIKLFTVKECYQLHNRKNKKITTQTLLSKIAGLETDEYNEAVAVRWGGDIAMEKLGIIEKTEDVGFEPVETESDTTPKSKDLNEILNSLAKMEINITAKVEVKII